MSCGARVYGSANRECRSRQCYRAITTNLDLSEDSPPGDIAGYHAYSYIMAGDSDDLDVTIYGNCRYGGSQENVIHRAWGVSCVKRFELATVDALGSFCEPAAEGIGSKGMGFKRICTKQGLIASAEAVIGKDPFDDERLVKKFPASKDCREGG